MISFLFQARCIGRSSPFSVWKTRLERVSGLEFRPNFRPKMQCFDVFSCPGCVIQIFFLGSNVEKNISECSPPGCETGFESMLLPGGQNSLKLELSELKVSVPAIFKAFVWKKHLTINHHLFRGNVFFLKFFQMTYTKQILHLSAFSVQAASCAVLRSRHEAGGDVFFVLICQGILGYTWQKSRQQLCHLDEWSRMNVELDLADLKIIEHECESV